ncbi:MAG: flagellar hook-associated protein 3 [Comamonadaceae bacterium]|nr:MAG: flagellar hook-associated protein 3 [Comamonadaceae bacterium]
MSQPSRLASANTFGNAIDRITARQSQLASLQEQLSAGKRVLRPSDDPTGAAQAERAITRLSRVATDQRALEVQRNAVAAAESTLGDAVAAVQDFRELVVQAGNSTLSTTDRASIAQRLSGLRDQLLGYANARDSNGQPLFGGLGSSAAPFSDRPGGVAYDGLAGQLAGNDTAIPAVLDGQSAWMNVPTGNGVFTVAQAAVGTSVWSDAGKVTQPAALTGHDYRIEFTIAGAATSYTVVDTTSNTTVQAAAPYVAGKPIEFDGLSLVANGTPASGEALLVKPSTRASLFGVLDQAIAQITAPSGGGGLSQGVAQALVQIDAGLSRLSSSRGQAGGLLNQVDDISDRQANRSVQLEADRSRAEDVDMVKAMSDFQAQQTAYSAALGSYAQIQKLSLFNFIG